MRTQVCGVSAGLVFCLASFWVQTWTFREEDPPPHIMAADIMAVLLPFSALLASAPPPPPLYNRRAVLTLASSGFGLIPLSAAAAGLRNGEEVTMDSEFPGTAVSRMNAIRQRARSLTEYELNGEWEAVRRRLLWAAGMKDLPDALPGQGWTGHAFNDAIHVDATAMLGEVRDNRNDGSVSGIAIGNRLGTGIQVASIPELGTGGSWSTCQLDTRRGSTDDVAHGQFQSRIAFKLVWCAPTFDSFVLVDDDGALLARGTPRGALPPLAERQANFEMVRGSKYAANANARIA